MVVQQIYQYEATIIQKDEQLDVPVSPLSWKFPQCRNCYVEWTLHSWLHDAEGKTKCVPFPKEVFGRLELSVTASHNPLAQATRFTMIKINVVDRFLVHSAPSIRLLLLWLPPGIIPIIIMTIIIIVIKLSNHFLQHTCKLKTATSPNNIVRKLIVHQNL